MSYKPQDWAFGLNIPTTPKFVLVYLARRAKADGSDAYPGLLSIQQATGLDRRTVQRNLRWLQETGLVEDATIARGGRGHRTGYRLCLDKGGPVPPLQPLEKAADNRPSKMERAALSPLKGGTQSRKGGADDVTIREGSVLEGITEASNSSPTTRKTTQSWEPPKWFIPMVGLEGYKKRNHDKACEVIRLYCEGSEVDPSAIVKQFASEWPWLKVEFGRSDPVQMLRNTKHVQVSKMRKKREHNGANGRRPSGVQRTSGGQKSSAGTGWDNRSGAA